MRNKTEFEARVRELAAAKQEVSKKKQKKIRSFTIAGGVLVCAACCVIVFTRIDIKMDGIKNKAPENSMEHLGIENKTEEAANSGNSVQQNTPGYSMGNSVMEDTIINESYVSIMREENFDGGTSRAVLLSGDNENAACLIEWIDSVKLNELSG